MKRPVPFIPPRVTHYPAPGGDPSLPLCGASVFDSITRSIQVCSNFSDCQLCINLKEGP